MEIGANILLKGTKVDAVYDKDPVKFADAVPYKKLTFLEVLQKEIKVMDAAAISLCMDNNMPIVVFNIGEKDNLHKVVTGKNIGTLVQ